MVEGEVHAIVSPKTRRRLHGVDLRASAPCPDQMIRYKTNVYATQFHPEADSKLFETRVKVYKDKGYFPPSDADRIIEFCHQQDVQVPGQILKNFVDAYR